MYRYECYVQLLRLLACVFVLYISKDLKFAKLSFLNSKHCCQATKRISDQSKNYLSSRFYPDQQSTNVLDAQCCLSSSFLYTFSDVCLVVRAYVCTVLQQTTFIYRQVLLVHCTALTTNYKTVKCTGYSPFARVLRIDCCLDSCSNILDSTTASVCIVVLRTHVLAHIPTMLYIIWRLETQDIQLKSLLMT